MKVAYKILPNLINYQKYINLQNFLVNLKTTNKTQTDLILCTQHTPTYTLGRRLRPDTQELKKLTSLGADYLETARGGKITFHGPGQLLVYPILNLKNFKLGVRDYVSNLENSIISTCGDYNIKAEKGAETGVWVENDRKIAAIGIQVQRYITSFGFGLNCNTDLKWFDHIIPCGLVGKSATSISKELSTNVEIESIIPVYLKNFKKEFLIKNNVDLDEKNEQSLSSLELVDHVLNNEIDKFLN
ncbi:hypothetical protein HDU92_002863 [Lobulomyces angularis]|nr:hypothetical protein HDU92_002863 [Lobulomyces angularis]